jgi:NAD(P)-dependent dehydrogenase (short-subunit alcohol dehydrogenase family)
MTGRPLEGRGAIITGANRGLGLAIARAYVDAGASVMLCARDSRELEKVASALEVVARDRQRVVTRTCDVTSEGEVREVVADALRELGRLHVLVNNAGVYGPKGALEDVDWTEWVRAIEINLHGSVLMARAVIPHFKQHGYGKIVQLSGGGATNPLPRISAYAASKAAIVRVAETIAEELRDFGVDVNSIAPGALNTRLLDEVLAAGPELVGQPFYEKALRQQREGGAPLDRGAALAVFLGSSASDGITGRLISAIWDGWERLPERAAELAATDVYTLRRIVAADRGFEWE